MQVLSLGIIRIGAFTAAGGARYNHNVDPLSIKILACRDATCFAQDNGYQQVHLETNCNNKKSRLWASVADRSYVCHLLREMREIVSSFQGYKLLYVTRQAKAAAYLVAKEVLNFGHCIMNYNVITAFLVWAVQANMPSPDE